MTTTFLAGLIALAVSGGAMAETQPRSKESPEFPRLKGAGGVFPIDNVSIDQAPEYRVLIDATKGELTSTGLNRELDLAARAVNLYALGGAPASKVRIAVVLHGEATTASLSDRAHQRLTGGSNPNTSLLEKLVAAGVEVYVCGQALKQQGFDPDDVSREVKVALSALTTLVELQGDGFRLVP